MELRREAELARSDPKSATCPVAAAVAAVDVVFVMLSVFVPLPPINVEYPEVPVPNPSGDRKEEGAVAVLPALVNPADGWLDDDDDDVAEDESP